MPNYRGELECQLLGRGVGEVTSVTPGKALDAMFDTKTGKILATGTAFVTEGAAERAKIKTEIKPFVEACRKILAAQPM
jgi:hypothetical protein